MFAPVLRTLFLAGLLTLAVAEDADGRYQGVSRSLENWKVVLARMPAVGWQVLAATRDARPVKVLDGFWPAVVQEGVPADLLEEVRTMIAEAELPFAERAAAAKARPAVNHRPGPAPRGGGFTENVVGGYYMAYSLLEIPPYSREWLVVMRRKQTLYSGPPETPAMQDVLSQATCDDIIARIDAHRQRWDERRATFQKRLEAVRAP